MKFWYGISSVIKEILSPEELEKINVLFLPNGVNRYQIDEVSVFKKLPESYVKLKIKYYSEKSIYENCSFLKKLLNKFISQGFIELIEDVNYLNNYYIPVDSEGRSIYISIKRLNLIDSKLKYYKSINIDDVDKIDDDNYVDFFSEASIELIQINNKFSKLHLDYILSSCYIYAAAKNQWLRPYATKIGFKTVGVDNKKVTHLVVPFWVKDDIDNYIEIVNELEKLDLPNPFTKYEPGRIKCIDNNWYPLHQKIINEIDYIQTIPKQSETVYFEEEKSDYIVSSVLAQRVPDVDWRLQNLAKVASVLPKGLLPFTFPYPKVMYLDFNDRININEDEAGIVVSLNPNNYILGTFDSNIKTKLLYEKFNKWWQNGYFLTNKGHMFYEGSDTYIDETSVSKILISETLFL